MDINNTLDLIKENFEDYYWQIDKSEPVLSVQLGNSYSSNVIFSHEEESHKVTIEINIFSDESNSFQNLMPIIFNESNLEYHRIKNLIYDISSESRNFYSDFKVKNLNNIEVTDFFINEYFI